MSNRFVVENENELVSPESTVICSTCVFRDKTTQNGYAKSICRKFDDVQSNHKPLAVLFENEKCKFYKKDSSK